MTQFVDQKQHLNGTKNNGLRIFVYRFKSCGLDILKSE